MAAQRDLPYGSYQDIGNSICIYLKSSFSAWCLATAYIGVPEKPDDGQPEDVHVGYEQSRIEIQDQ